MSPEDLTPTRVTIGHDQSPTSERLSPRRYVLLGHEALGKHVARRTFIASSPSPDRHATSACLPRHLLVFFSFHETATIAADFLRPFLPLKPFLHLGEHRGLSLIRNPFRLEEGPRTLAKCRTCRPPPRTNTEGRPPSDERREASSTGTQKGSLGYIPLLGGGPGAPLWCLLVLPSSG